MAVNGISFKGLWEHKSHKKIGKIQVDVKPYEENVYLEELVYHPFSDETPEDIKAQVDKYNNKLIESKGTYHPAVPTWLTVIHPQVGSKLPFSSDLYKKISEMKVEPYKDNDDSCIYFDEVHPSKEEEVNKLLSVI